MSIDAQWDTNELIAWISNDEGLYLTFSSTVWSADEVENWFRNHGTPANCEVDLGEVDWEAVADHIEEEL